MKTLACDNADFEKAPGVAVLNKRNCSGDGVFKFDTVKVKFILDLHAANCVYGYKLNALSFGAGKAFFQSFVLIMRGSPLFINVCKIHGQIVLTS